MARLDLDCSDIDRLQKAMENYQGNTENAINDVLHTEVFGIVEPSIRQLIPVSDPAKVWRSKLPHARLSKSLTQENGNLSVTVKSTASYNYLYFPDDGTNTRRHIGNQQFFKRGGEAKVGEIVDRCINRLINDFEKGV